MRCEDATSSRLLGTAIAEMVTTTIYLEARSSYLAVSRCHPSR